MVDTRMQFQESMVARTFGVGRIHDLKGEDENLATIPQWKWMNSEPLRCEAQATYGSTGLFNVHVITMMEVMEVASVKRIGAISTECQWYRSVTIPPTKIACLTSTKSTASHSKQRI